MTSTTDSPADTSHPPASTATDIRAFDPDLPYEVHPQVEIRPEPFGALLYSFKTRRLSFLKDPTLVTVVRTLADHPSAAATCRAADITDPARAAQFARALATLAATETIRERRS